MDQDNTEAAVITSLDMARLHQEGMVVAVAVVDSNTVPSHSTDSSMVSNRTTELKPDMEASPVTEAAVRQAMANKEINPDHLEDTASKVYFTVSVIEAHMTDHLIAGYGGPAGGYGGQSGYHGGPQNYDNHQHNQYGGAPTQQNQYGGGPGQGQYPSPPGQHQQGGGYGGPSGPHTPQPGWQ